MSELSFLGDSMFATGLDTASFRTGNRWLSGLIASFLGYQFSAYYNNSTGGHEILECASDVGNIPATADWVITNAGINDLDTADMTASTLIANYGELLDALGQAGKKVIVVAPLPLMQGGELQIEDDRRKFVEFLKGLDTEVGVYGVIDAQTYDRDGTSETYDPSIHALDGTHPNTDICFFMAKKIADEVALIMEANGVAPQSVGSNLLGRSGFLGASGTSTNAHIYGGIPNGYRFLDAQALSEEIRVSTEIKDGGVVHFDLAGATTGGSDFFRETTPTVDLTAGQTVITSFDMKTSGCRGLVGFYSQLTMALSGGTQYLSGGYASPADAALDYRKLPPNMDWVTVHSPPIEVTENLSGCAWRFAFQYLDDTTLGGRLSVRRPRVLILQ